MNANGTLFEEFVLNNRQKTNKVLDMGIGRQCKHLIFLVLLLPFCSLAVAQCPDLGEIKTGNDQCIQYVWTGSKPNPLPDPLTITTSTGTLVFDLKADDATSAIYQLQGVNGNPCTGGGYGMPNGSSLFPHSTTFDGVSCSFAADGSADNLLPIRLTNLQVASMQSEVLINWSAESIFASDYYAIERSRDGIDFREIGVVGVDTDALGVVDYTYSDIHPMSGTNYYRISQLDFDGTWSHSHTLVVKRKSDTEKVKISQSEGVLYISSEFENGIVELHSINGSSMMRNEFVGRFHSIDVRDITPGIYAIRVSNGSIQQTRKVILQ